MPFDFAELKSQVRQVLHENLAVPARYFDDALGMPVDLRIRWHTKIDRFGDIENLGYSEVVEGINRVIFNRTELVEKGVVLRSGGSVTIVADGYDDVELILATREPYDGPVEEVWLVGVRSP